MNTASVVAIVILSCLLFLICYLEAPMKKPKLGSGKRFAAIEKKAAASGAKNPKAVAAAAGIAKYGKAKMEKMAAKGKAAKGK